MLISRKNHCSSGCGLTACPGCSRTKWRSYSSQVIPSSLQAIPRSVGLTTWAFMPEMNSVKMTPLGKISHWKAFELPHISLHKWPMRTDWGELQVRLWQQNWGSGTLPLLGQGQEARTIISSANRTEHIAGMLGNRLGSSLCNRQE